MKISTGLANSLLSGAPLNTALQDGEIRLYAGAEPASADDAVGSATLIGTYKANGAGLRFATQAVDGLLGKDDSQVWNGQAVAQGTARWFRHVLPGDNGGQSSTAVRIQGTFGVVGTTIVAMNNTFDSGAQLPPLESYYVAMPLWG